jgi:aryl-alcohol dehydrogenase-like predicted oxidoreductase
MKIGLGTVQLGLDYGISNDGGKVTKGEAGAIIADALRAGVDLFDTAPRYGDSELVVGELLPHRSGVKLVTKTPQFDGPRRSCNDAGLLVRTLNDSLTRLRVPAAYGLMIHRAEDMLAEGGEYLFEAMQELKSEGLVSKIGVSVYSADQIDRLLHRYSLDLVQLPLSVLDQRLVASGHLRELHSRGVEIHARSVFLQGLLLMKPDLIPRDLAATKPKIAAFNEWCEAHGLLPVQGALAFIRQIDQVDYVIVGVTSASELKELIAGFEVALGENADFAPFACADERVLNPVHWTYSAQH